MRRVLCHAAPFVLVLGWLATPASAALITDTDPNPDLVLDTAPTSFYQQTTSSPCVIGGNNCQNPATFTYTEAATGGGGVLHDYTSPLYTTAQITAIVDGSNAFTVGLDYNQSNEAQRLDYFAAFYYTGAVLSSSQVFDISTSLPTNNNGVGYSDFLLSGFLIPENVTNVQFRAIWWNNDGADRYFIIEANAEPCRVNCTQAPEPASLALFGLAAVAAGMARRRMR